MTISFLSRIALSIVTPSLAIRPTVIRAAIGEKMAFRWHTQANGIVWAYNVPRTDQPALAVSVHD
jgi:hypothetical protein